MGLSERETQVIYELELPPSLVHEVYGAEDFEKDYYLFTGRGLSRSSLHLGHYLTYSVLARLSQKRTVFFQVSNDEKRSQVQGFMSLDQVRKQTSRLLNDLSKFDWNFQNVVFFQNMDVEDRYVLENAAQYLSSEVKQKTLTSLFGPQMSPFNYYYYLIQGAPLLILDSILKKVPVIITAEDQKGIFLCLRDLCQKVRIRKPVVVVLDPLLDTMMQEKMSSSIPSKAVFLDPSAEKALIKAKSGEKNFCEYLVRKLAVVNEDLERIDLKDFHNRTLDLKKKVYELTSEKFTESETSSDKLKLGLLKYINIKFNYSNPSELQRLYLNGRN